MTGGGNKLGRRRHDRGRRQTHRRRPTTGGGATGALSMGGGFDQPGGADGLSIRRYDARRCRQRRDSAPRRWAAGRGRPAAGIVRLRDVARVELGAQNYNQAAPSTATRRWAWPSFSCPAPTRWTSPTGSGRRWRSSRRDFPEGVDYAIAYDTTPFIRESVADVVQTLLEAVVLVALVVLVFLQNWRAALIPLIAVPVAIVGTFAVMAALGFSLNNISLFGLVLAIGIVVDDAIVVVENVERWLDAGPAAARGGAQGDGRSHRPGDRRGPGALRRVRALRVHQRHHRPVLPPVRRDDRRLDGHLGVQLADAQPGAGGHPAASRTARGATR